MITSKLLIVISYNSFEIFDCKKLASNKKRRYKTTAKSGLHRVKWCVSSKGLLINYLIKTIAPPTQRFANTADRQKHRPAKSIKFHIMWPWVHCECGSRVADSKRKTMNNRNCESLDHWYSPRLQLLQKTLADDRIKGIKPNIPGQRIMEMIGKKNIFGIYMN